MTTAADIIGTLFALLLIVPIVCLVVVCVFCTCLAIRDLIRIYRSSR
jgi:hypothetical protein